MSDPAKKLSADPVERARLAQEFLHLLAERGADETLFAWMQEHIPRQKDALALLELALESCTPGSPFAELREGLLAVAATTRQRIEEHEAFCDQLFERDPFGAVRRLFYEMGSNGALPADWRTREGEVLPALRWYQEFMEAWDALGRSAGAKDLEGMRAAFVRVYETLETTMDRLLTLPPEHRGALLPDFEPLYRKLMERKDENLGA